MSFGWRDALRVSFVPVVVLVLVTGCIVLYFLR
jgi:hypothetical protein